jgi:hypothetical protein
MAPAFGFWNDVIHLEFGFVARNATVGAFVFVAL